MALAALRPILLGHSLDFDSTVFRRYSEQVDSLNGHNPIKHVPAIPSSSGRLADRASAAVVGYAADQSCHDRKRGDGISGESPVDVAAWTSDRIDTNRCLLLRHDILQILGRKGLAVHHRNQAHHARAQTGHPSDSRIRLAIIRTMDRGRRHDGDVSVVTLTGWKFSVCARPWPKIPMVETSICLSVMTLPIEPLSPPVPTPWNGSRGCMRGEQTVGIRSRN